MENRQKDKKDADAVIKERIRENEEVYPKKRKRKNIRKD